MADEDAYEDSIYVFKASAPWNPHVPKPFRSFFQKSLISPAALCLPGACSLLRTRPSCSRTRPLRVLHARACPRMAEKAAKEEAIRVRKEEAFCTHVPSVHQERNLIRLCAASYTPGHSRLTTLLQSVPMGTLRPMFAAKNPKLSPAQQKKAQFLQMWESAAWF